MDTFVELHSGYFWGAWKIYNWSKDDPGVGIAVTKITGALPEGKVMVKSKYDKLSIKASLAKATADLYKSYMKIGKRKIAVIPKSKFTKEV